MFSPNVINGVLQSRFDEITTHLNHQLSFSPLSNKGHILVDDNFYDFEVDNEGHMYSPQKLEGYDFYGGKSYLGHYNDMNFSPSENIFSAHMNTLVPYMNKTGTLKSMTKSLSLEEKEMLINLSNKLRPMINNMMNQIEPLMKDKEFNKRKTLYEHVEYLRLQMETNNFSSMSPGYRDSVLDKVREVNAGVNGEIDDDFFINLTLGIIFLTLAMMYMTGERAFRMY